MPRSFDLSAEYQGSVDQVLSALADEQYWLARLADSGADAAILEALDVADDGSIAVATTQTLRADRLPAVVAQLHRGDLQIKRQERWSPVDNGRSTTAIDATIPGAPVAVRGTGSLHPVGAGSQVNLDINVEVKIPLVGGKVEGLIGGQLVDLLITEQRFTTAWIADKHRGP